MLIATLFAASTFLPINAVEPLEAKTQEVQRLEAKGDKTAAMADAYYALGKHYYEALRDYAKAEDLMRKSLAVEVGLKRAEHQLATRFALASILTLSGKSTEARGEYDAARDFANREKLTSEVPTILNNLGVTLMAAGKLDQSESLFREALNTSETPENKAQALLNLAEVEHERTQPDKALKLLEEAVKHLSQKDPGAADLDAQLKNLAAQEIPPDEYLNVLRDMAVIKSETGKLQESIDNWRAILNTPMLDESWIATVNLGIAENYWEMQSITEAKDHFEKALTAVKGDPKSDKHVQALIGLGSVYADLGNFDAAEQFHKRALDLATEQGNKSRVMQAIIQLGNDSLLRGAPEHGLHFLLESSNKLNNENISAEARGQLMISIGRCYNSLGQSDAAIKYYGDALKEFEKTKNPSLRALALNSLAVAYLDTYKFNEFNNLYKEAKELYAQVKDVREDAKFEYNYAQSLVIQHKPAEAIPVYQTALAKAAQVKDGPVQCSILRGLGTAHLLSGNAEAALAEYKKALVLAEKSTSIEPLWDSNLGVGKAYKALKQYDQAEPHLRKSVELVEAERSKLSRDSFKTHNLDLRADCYSELVDLLALTNRPLEGLEIAERGRARAFLDLLASRQRRRVDLASVGPQLLVASAGHVAEAGTRGVGVAPKATLTVEETAISPVNADAPDSAEIKAILGKGGSTCVEYFVLRDKVVAWVASPDGTVKQALCPISKAELYKQVSNAQKAIITPPKNADDVVKSGLARQAALKGLHKILIDPIDAMLPKDKDAVVTFIPHEFLFNVPFAALIGSDGNYLVEKHTLAYAPALGVLRATQRLAHESSGNSKKLLAFGNPITKEIAFLGALPYAEKEVQKIAEIFGLDNSMVRTGGTATKAEFAKLVPSASAIHLATHGLIDEEHPMQSAVVLAPTSSDDGLLTVKEILSLKDLKANMVVLSACQTARGKITGDGVVGLSRAFIIAGTPSILVSQWNVDDIMTEFQMKQFYKAYLSGQDKAKALRNAQLATISFMENGTLTPADPAAQAKASARAADYVRANPRYWAAFELIGEK